MMRFLLLAACVTFICSGGCLAGTPAGGRIFSPQPMLKLNGYWTYQAIRDDMVNVSVVFWNEDPLPPKAKYQIHEPQLFHGEGRAFSELGHPKCNLSTPCTLSHLIRADHDSEGRYSFKVIDGTGYQVGEKLHFKITVADAPKSLKWDCSGKCHSTVGDSLVVDARTLGYPLPHICQVLDKFQNVVKVYNSTDGRARFNMSRQDLAGHSTLTLVAVNRLNDSVSKVIQVSIPSTPLPTRASIPNNDTVTPQSTGDNLQEENPYVPPANQQGTPTNPAVTVVVAVIAGVLVMVAIIVLPWCCYRRYRRCRRYCRSSSRNKVQASSNYEGADTVSLRDDEGDENKLGESSTDGSCSSGSTSRSSTVSSVPPPYPPEGHVAASDPSGRPPAHPVAAGPAGVHTDVSALTQAPAAGGAAANILPRVPSVSQTSGSPSVPSELSSAIPPVTQQGETLRAPPSNPPIDTRPPSQPIVDLLLQLHNNITIGNIADHNSSRGNSDISPPPTGAFSPSPPGEPLSFGETTMDTLAPSRPIPSLDGAGPSPREPLMDEAKSYEQGMYSMDSTAVSVDGFAESPASLPPMRDVSVVQETEPPSDSGVLPGHNRLTHPVDDEDHSDIY